MLISQVNEYLILYVYIYNVFLLIFKNDQQSVNNQQQSKGNYVQRLVAEKLLFFRKKSKVASKDDDDNQDKDIVSISGKSVGSKKNGEENERESWDNGYQFFLASLGYASKFHLLIF